MSKQNITLRVPEDTYQEFERYREKKGGISKADAGRRLLDRALNESWMYRTLTEIGRLLAALSIVAALALWLTPFSSEPFVLVLALVTVAVNSLALGGRKRGWF